MQHIECANPFRCALFQQWHFSLTESVAWPCCHKLEQQMEGSQLRRLLSSGCQQPLRHCTNCPRWMLKVCVRCKSGSCRPRTSGCCWCNSCCAAYMIVSSSHAFDLRMSWCSVFKDVFPTSVHKFGDGLFEHDRPGWQYSLHGLCSLLQRQLRLEQHRVRQLQWSWTDRRKSENYT